MPGIPGRPVPCSRRRAGDEAGFALIEVIVSAVLLIVLALATLSVLDRAQSTSSNNRSRDVAAQLAQSEQDTIRQLPITELAGGYHPGTIAKNVGGIDYQVTSTADWVQDSGGAVTCSTTGRVAYLQTKTEVTWPGMGTIKPVTADAIVDPGVAALGATKGALTVLLSGANGSGTPGVTVTADGMSSVTDANGCAVIGNLDAGPQTLTYSEPGYVDKDSKQPVSKAVTIGAGTISQATGSYDRVGRLNLALVDDATPTAAAAWWPSVTFDNSMRSTPTLLAVPTDASSLNTTRSLDLYPFPTSYKTYVGDCVGNDPSNALYGGVAPGAQLNPGDIKSLPLTMRRATIEVNGPASGKKATIRMTPERSVPSMSACLPNVYGNSWTVNNPGSGTITFSIPVPVGVWKICANYQYSDSNWNQKRTIVGGAIDDDPIVNTPATATGIYTTDLYAKIAVQSSSSGGENFGCS